MHLGKTYKFEFLLGLIIALIFVLGYMLSSKQLYVKERVSNRANQRAIDVAISKIKTGDLIVRRGDDMTSAMLASLNKHDKRYSHCGLVIVESNQLFVIHSIGGEDNPNQKIKKEKIEHWISVQNNLAFAAYRYNLHDSVLKQLILNVYDCYSKEILFDMAFDLKTDERMYCSEMIYKAMQKATDLEVIKVEEDYNRVFVGIDNLYLSDKATLICEVEYK